MLVFPVLRRCFCRWR